MSDVPTIELMDAETVHADGEFTERHPVKVHTMSKDEAREVAQVLTEAWKEKHGDSE